MQKLLLALKVLRKGERLVHAATWKTVTAATTVIVLVLPEFLKLVCASTGFCIDLTPVMLNEISGALANLGVGMFILYSTYATSKKVGYVPRAPKV